MAGNADLTSYLDAVPLLRDLTSEDGVAVAQKISTRRLKGGETICLRGEHVNTLCLVTHGRVKVERFLRDGCTSCDVIEPGQTTDPLLLVMGRRILRVQFTALSEDVALSMLWYRDLVALPLLRRRLRQYRRRYQPSQAGFITRTGRRVLRGIGRRALTTPIMTGILIALLIAMALLFFTPPGRQTLADWRYVRALSQTTLSPERHRDHILQVLALDPLHAAATIELGNQAARSGDAGMAERYYYQVREQSGAAANNVGTLLLARGEVALAAGMFSRSIEIAPDVAVVHQNLGIAYLRLDRHDEAIRAFREAVRIDPNVIVARYHLGMHYLSQGNFIRAGAAFERVLEQDATCFPAHIGLGLAYAGAGNVEQAIQAFRQSAQLQPRSITAHFYLGWANAQTGDRSAAEAALTHVLDLHPPPDLAERVHFMLEDE